MEILNESGSLTVASIRFPVLPHPRDTPIMHELMDDYYDVVAYCYYISSDGDRLCSANSWSSAFPGTRGLSNYSSTPEMGVFIQIPSPKSLHPGLPHFEAISEV